MYYQDPNDWQNQSPLGTDAIPPPAGQWSPDVLDPMRNPNVSPGPEYFWNGTTWELTGTGSATDTTKPLDTAPKTPLTPGPASGVGGYGGYGGMTGDMPGFNAPRFGVPEFVYNRQFSAPTREELTNDPSFQFRLDQGRKALEQSAAGKGVLRTGGTLKDLVNYGQNFATNEYSNVYNRKFGEYKFDYDKEADIYSKNYGVKRDVFDRNYKAAYDEYAPKQRGWELNFNRDWQRYMYDRDAEQRDFT